MHLLEAQLNDFSAQTRHVALIALAKLAGEGKVPCSSVAEVANMHCHTFYSYNAYGYSPSGIAWLARSRGYKLMGIVDFDVLDGVDEFLEACDLVGVRGSAGLETRIYVPQFATREINSPGEPGVAYHMGIGFTSCTVPPEAQSILADMRQRAEQRNRDMLARLNGYLDPLKLDYDAEVLPLTPSGNATERHILAAYTRAAEQRVNDPLKFWSQKLDMEAEKLAEIMANPVNFHNHLRSKLMKRGGVGYVQPGADTFPEAEEVNRLTLACGALPCAAWLDGLSDGEQAMQELLQLLMDGGVVALNIIPDRNWNIADPELKRRKVQNLYEVVSLARALDLPLNVGTEMNSPGQKLVDDFSAPELEPLRQAFMDGAYFIYGHTLLQRLAGMGYQSEWARDFFPERSQRNVFYTQIGKVAHPGADILQQIRIEMSPEDVLKLLSELCSFSL